jgi:hypothetical protein
MVQAALAGPPEAQRAAALGVHSQAPGDAQQPGPAAGSQAGPTTPAMAPLWVTVRADSRRSKPQQGGGQS